MNTIQFERHGCFKSLVLALPASHYATVDRSLSLSFPISKMEDWLPALPFSTWSMALTSLVAICLLATTFLSTPSSSVGAHQHTASLRFSGFALSAQHITCSGEGACLQGNAR